MAPNRILKHFNRTLAVAFTVVAISTFNYGFDNAGYSTTQAMDAFQKQFGDQDPTTGKWKIPPTWLSLFNSLNYIGFAAGVIIGSLVSARWGRRWCMFGMSAWAVIPATIALTSSTREQIMAARILNYIYVGMELAVVPVYQSEIVPSEIRGFAVGSYQFSLMFGTLIVNSVCRGTSTLEGNPSWRIPMGLFYVIPVIVMCLIFFIPESPRWLLTQDRVEEAHASLKKLRVGTITDVEIDEQFAALQYALKQEVEQGKYWELFKGVNLKRTAVVMVMNFFQQATGQAFASTYGAIFIKDIGTVNPFTMTIVNAIVNLVMVFIGLYLTDRVGRRPLLLIGAVLQFAAIVTMGSLGTVSDPSFAVKTGIVAMLTVFAASYVLAWAPLNYVVSTEIPALRLRDASQRTASMVNVLANFLVNFSIPHLLYTPGAGLGSKVGFIFAGILVLAFVFTWFCIPECKGKSLEQIDRMFNEGVPLRKFGKYKPEDMYQASTEDGEKAGMIVTALHEEKA
ncbi:MFS transporter fmqE [Colletotrichum fructicola]|uniref:MFS transporter fmqE n=1 Tax=Colletotrichum fructicola (strain Nara gc5) TaxID=1213859 RepID=L2FPV9_COLFN|nr:MFS transporter fmqE [Colletotrichum fructicola]KAF4492694.1 MFS transporter fmqE [Colletotrichum fructicola Nara gc5]KAF4892264.1 MFS transporter fmqE [Colletotrichum fructicola]KAF4897678.1 MFS transporter fmqE [Colletotrichum fructicola]KAF4927531.1 MFS transporter fmqE [Colletotrichum fructicola]